MKKRFVSSVWCSVLLVLVIGLAAGCSKTEDRTPAASHDAHAKAKYHCPMHPTYVSDKPGSCPICGMNLVLIEDDDAPGTGTTASAQGRTTISIRNDRREQIGLTTVPVEKRKLERLIRASATIEYDETRWTKVNPRIGGWVRELYVNYTGQTVEKGQPLFKLYSPDLLATQREYVNALKSGDASLIQAARRRLELWDISEDQIAALEKGGLPSDTMEMQSPATGTVIEKNVTQGGSFMPGESLYSIADLSHLWVHAFIYEFELPYVRTGQVATVEISHGSRLYHTQVEFIYPNVDELSRTVEIRLSVDNRDLALRPDMWATVEIEADLGEMLTVPSSAVIDTGTRHIAFVDQGDGHLEPRKVKVGGRTDDFLQIRGGLAEGERVVTRALFLVDAESQLKAAIAGMDEQDGGGEH